MAGYLPAKKLTIAIAVTVLPEAFDAVGDPRPKVVRYIFRNLAMALGGADTLPPPPSG